MATKKDITLDARAMRAKRGLNQSQFWGRIGVTQSGGSRYESGRTIPGPVQKLLVIAYGTDKQREELVEELKFVKTKTKTETATQGNATV